MLSSSAMIRAKHRNPASSPMASTAPLAPPSSTSSLRPAPARNTYIKNGGQHERGLTARELSETREASQAHKLETRQSKRQSQSMKCGEQMENQFRKSPQRAAGFTIQAKMAASVGEKESHRTLCFSGPPIAEEHREAAQRADTMTSSQIVPALAKHRVQELREEAPIVAHFAEMSNQAEHREDAQSGIHPQAANLAVPVCTTHLPMLIDSAMVIQLHHGHFGTTNDYLGSDIVGITHRLTKRLGHPHPPIDGKEVVMPWGAEFFGTLEPELINETKWIKMVRPGEPPENHDKFRRKIAAATRRMLKQYPESPLQGPSGGRFREEPVPTSSTKRRSTRQKSRTKIGQNSSAATPQIQVCDTSNAKSTKSAKFRTHLSMPCFVDKSNDAKPNAKSEINSATLDNNGSEAEKSSYAMTALPLTTLPQASENAEGGICCPVTRQLRRMIDFVSLSDEDFKDKRLTNSSLPNMSPMSSKRQHGTVDYYNNADTLPTSSKPQGGKADYQKDAKRMLYRKDLHPRSRNHLPDRCMPRRKSHQLAQRSVNQRILMPIPALLAKSSARQLGINGTSQTWMTSEPTRSSTRQLRTNNLGLSIIPAERI